MTRYSRFVLVAALSACSAASQSAPRGGAQARTQWLLTTLAHDSMEGRGTATPGGDRAARFIADEMKQLGLTPGGDAGYLQRVPLRALPPNNAVPRPTTSNTPPRVTPPAAPPCANGYIAPAGAAPATNAGRSRLVTMPSMSSLDTIPSEQRRTASNVIGILPGSDPALRDEVILVLSHYDHLGIRGPGVCGDSIYNGADDDASGTVAVLEIARLLKADGPPRRTVIFASMTGEEMGMLGTRYFIQNPARPLANVVAGFEIEMIGRPDSLAGGHGKAWLTGYERSTMGDMLKQFGIEIVPDPRPSQSFFTRSDNYAFARMGIVAHTMSSFNLHTDYHRPSDEASLTDFAHMTAVIGSAARAVRHLADGPKPAWHPGGNPAAGAKPST